MSHIINQHLSTDLLIRALDDELSTAERVVVESHLSACEFCRAESAALNQVSLAVESIVEQNGTDFVLHSDAAFRRRQLQVALESKVEGTPEVHTPAKVLHRFGWGMAIAATLAFGIVIAPKRDVVIPINPHKADLTQPASPAQQANVVPVRASSPVLIEVDGESFTPLPYSNPDLPVSDEHIVQMQVPVSSLTDLGIIWEPVVSRVSHQEDSSVLADVLLGSDGQPRGVHVLGAEQ